MENRPGLYFHHHNEVLQAKAARWVTVTPPNRVPPEHFRVFVNQPEAQSRGQYPGVFDYKFGKYPEGHYWALLFWDRIIVTVVFHDPSCSCSKCHLDASERRRIMQSVFSARPVPRRTSPGKVVRSAAALKTLSIMVNFLQSKTSPPVNDEYEEKAPGCYLVLSG
jgi:hypothetical protein